MHKYALFIQVPCLFQICTNMQCLYQYMIICIYAQYIIEYKCQKNVQKMCHKMQIVQWFYRYFYFALYAYIYSKKYANVQNTKHEIHIQNMQIHAQPALLMQPALDFQLDWMPWERLLRVHRHPQDAEGELDASQGWQRCRVARVASRSKRRVAPSREPRSRSK